MARRRNATALFEVIHAAKLEHKPAASALKTPRWWFKGRDAAPSDASAAPVAQSDPNDPTANVTAATLFQSRHRPADPPLPAPATLEAPPPVAPPAPIEDVVPVRIDPAPVAPAVVAAVAAPPAEATAMVRAPRVVPVFDESALAPPPARAPGTGGFFSSIVRRSGMRVAFDADRQEMTLRVRYMSALVTGFTVLVVIILAFALGRHTAEGPSTAAAPEAPSAGQVKKGAAQPGVLDVRSARPASARVDGSAPAPRPAAPAAFVDAPVGPDGVAQRTNGYNYLLIQCYPPEKYQTALSVRDSLTLADIPCTVEKGSPQNHAPTGWHAVIGTRGFPGAGLKQSPEYAAYQKSIDAAVAKFPAKSKFDKVQPLGFKWVE